MGFIGLLGMEGFRGRRPFRAPGSRVYGLRGFMVFGLSGLQGIGAPGCTKSPGTCRGLGREVHKACVGLREQ